MQTTEELDSAYAAAKEEVEAWEKGEGVHRPSPRRFVLDFAWPAVAEPSTYAGTQLPFLDRTFTTDKGVITRITGVEATYSARGTQVSTGANAIYEIPAARRSVVFTFSARIKDNGTNREWSNTWIPGPLFATGDRNGLIFTSARGVLPGGSDVTVSINALFHGVNASVTGLTAINQHFLQMCFIGEQVKIA